jgi:hypothetical protein
MAISTTTTVRYVRKGADGVTIKDCITYYCVTATATIYNDGIRALWDEDRLEVIYDDSTHDNAWTSSVIQATDDKPYLWRFSATGYSDLSIISEGPVCIGHYGKQGKQGVQGPYIQYRGEWSKSKIYYNQTTGDDIKAIDVVSYGDDFYMCRKTNIGQNPEDDFNTDSVYWTQANFQEFIATQLLLAKNAVIAFSQGQQILLQDADGNITAGAKGASTSANDIRFWAGTTGTNPDLEAAPFRVYEDGSIVATNARITGKLEATQRPELNGLPEELTKAGYYEAGNSAVATIPDTVTSNNSFQSGDIIRIYDTSGTETSLAQAAAYDAKRGMMRLTEQWDVTGESIYSRDGVTLKRTTSNVVGPLFKELASDGTVGIGTYMPTELTFFGGYIELTCVVAPSSQGSQLYWVLNASNTPVMVWSKKFSSSVGGYYCEVYYINGIAQAYYHSNPNF